MMKKRIGIVGGGQLGRMMTDAAHKLGFTVTVIDPTPNSPAGQVADKQITAHYTDENAIRQLGEESDFITFEIELANAAILDELSEKGLQINPSAKTLTIIKDKLEQKKFLSQNGIPVADFVGVENIEDIKNAGKEFGYPFLLKARFDAYDGRGNALIDDESQIESAFTKLGGKNLYVEKFVPFMKELAINMVRNSNNEILSYPVVQTIHKNNICHIVSAPAPVNDKVKEQARRFGEQTMEHINGAGVFGIEMFLTKDGKVLLNEIAPRVHNSGHYTIEACKTSQFEQHIRAITGMPLGATDMIVPAAVMINILGERNGKAEPRGIEEAEAIPGVKVHIYGKIETRIERKMGHITAVADTLGEAAENAKRARDLITI
jgi:5-(carboxyamino)imidazole ribonucleotide synthase